MTDSTLLLRVLQDGDSFFPFGAVSFSWGLETLCAEGAIGSEQDVEAFVHAHLLHRWAQFDRPAVVAAVLASNSVATVGQIDRIVEAQTLAGELRSGSRRSGKALLAVHVKLDTPGAREYQAQVHLGEAEGHLAPMQGFLWSRRGIPEREAAILSAHTMCIGLLGAAVRIGAIGHVAAQKILKGIHGDIAAIAGTRPVDLDRIHAFMPQAEIASMRHEVAQVRLFAN